MGFSENFLIFGIQIAALFAAIMFGMRAAGTHPSTSMGDRHEVYDQLAFATFATMTLALFFNGA